MAIQIGLYGIDSLAPIPLKIGPLGLYIGPNDPCGGIFALGNMCFRKPGSNRDLWVPLKFCHQGGAWGPLLPTRLPHLDPCRYVSLYVLTRVHIDVMIGVNCVRFNMAAADSQVAQLVIGGLMSLI